MTTILAYRDPRTVAIAMLIALAGAVPRAAAMELSSTQIALLVHDGQTGRGAVAAIAALLTKQYGVAPDAVAEIAGSRSDLDKAAWELGQHARGSVDVFVFVSLPARSEDRRVFFRGKDTSARDPWTWLSRDEILDWLAKLPLRSALMLHPGCSDDRTEPLPRPPTSRRAGRPLSVWLLTFCATDGRPSAKQASPDDGRGVVAQALFDTLRETAEGGLTGIDAPTLLGQLQRKVPGVRFWLQEPTGLAADRFAFVKRPMAAQTATPRPSALPRTEARWRNTLQSLVLEANSGDAAAERKAVEIAETAVRDPGTPEAIRPLAIEALAEMRGKEASAALLRLARDDRIDPNVRRAAVTELVRKGDPVPLRSLLDDPEPSIRQSALRGSGILKDAEVADAWVAAAAPGNEPGVQLAGIQNLGLLKREEDRERLSAVVRNPSQDPTVRCEAITVLGTFPSRPETTALILAQLKDREPTVRRASAYALATVPADDPERTAVERGIGDALRDPADRVRQGAAFAAGQLRAARMIDALARAVVDEEEQERVRVGAADALAKIGRPEGVPSLVKASRSKVPGVRRAAVTALGKLGGPDALDAVVARLDDPDPYVRDEAARTVGEVSGLDRKTVARGLEDGSPRVRAAITKKVDVADESNRERLLKALDDEAPEVRAAAIERLASDPSDHSVERLAREIESDNPRRAEGACLAIGGIDTPAARQVLFDAARSPDPVRRRNAVRALGSQRDPSVAPILQQASRDPDPGVRQAVAEALARAGTSQANTDELKKLAVDGAPEVKETAIEGLRRSNQMGVRGTSSP